VRDVYLLSEIRRVHEGSDGVYGQLKIWDELNDEGVVVARCTVERLMRKPGIEGLCVGCGGTGGPAGHHRGPARCSPREMAM